MSPPTGELSIKVLRANGKVEDLGVVSRDIPLFMQQRHTPRWLRILAGTLLWLVAAGLLLALWALFRKLLLSFLVIFGIVTNAGINYMMADFLAASTNHIAAFNFHDSGTGTTAATVTDTALQTPTGTARSTGAQSNPAANQYKSIGTITYAGPFAVTEWGLLSAATVGTLWDHRIFGAVNVLSGDSIQYTYIVQGNSGGS